MPHDGFNHVAGTAVMQPVAFERAGTFLMQPSAPQRSGAAPAGANIVLHVQAVLYQVGVRPYFLVRIAGQFGAAGEESAGVGVAVFTGCPAGSVAIAAPHLGKQLLAPLYRGVVEIACCRYSQSPVPYHQVGVVFVAHLDRQVGRHQIVVDVLFDSGLGFPFGEIVVEASLNLGVFRRLLGIGLSHVMIAAVRTGHVGDVPDGVGAGGILQGAAAEGIGEPIGVLLARTSVAGAVVAVLAYPLAVLEDFGVQCEIVVFLLFGIFGFQVLVVDGIEQSRAVDADGRLEPDIYLVGRKGAAVGGDEVYIVGVGGNRHFGVDQFIGGTVGKGISPAVGIRFPGNLDFIRIYRQDISDKTAKREGKENTYKITLKINN